MLIKKHKRLKRYRRIRAKISGANKVPRLCVFRSAKHIYAQLIDDEKGHTLISANDLEIKQPKIPPKKSARFALRRARREARPIKLGGKKQKTTPPGGKERMGKVNKAYEVGKLIAKKALEKKIEKVVFDRAGYKYHGRVKALAEGAREGGLKF